MPSTLFTFAPKPISSLRPGRNLSYSAAMSGEETATRNTVFIGHGRSLVWVLLKDFLQDRLCLLWDEFNRESTAGFSTLERLREMLEKAKFAFLVLTAEDEHADGTFHPRENVIHEAGLFQGRLGFKRAIILREQGCAEFSNIHGLTQILFPRGNISACFEEIRKVLEREGVVGQRHTDRKSSKTGQPIANLHAASRSEPNVQLVAVNTPRIQFEEENRHTHRCRFFESDDSEHPFGVVLSFRNESQATGVVEARYVRTQIIYRNKKGNEVGHGTLGSSWMDDSSDAIHIPVGSTQHALVAIIGNDGKRYTPWVKQRDLFLSTESYVWPSAASSLEVRLIDEHKEWLLNPILLDVGIRNKRPLVVVRKQLKKP